MQTLSKALDKDARLDKEELEQDKFNSMQDPLPPEQVKMAKYCKHCGESIE